MIEMIVEMSHISLAVDFILLLLQRRGRLLRRRKRLLGRLLGSTRLAGVAFLRRFAIDGFRSREHDR